MAQRRDIKNLPVGFDLLAITFCFGITKRFYRKILSHEFTEYSSIWVLDRLLNQFGRGKAEVLSIEDVTNGFDGKETVRIKVEFSNHDVDLVAFKQELCDYLEENCKSLDEPSSRE